MREVSPRPDGTFCGSDPLVVAVGLQDDRAGDNRVRPARDVVRPDLVPDQEDESKQETKYRTGSGAASHAIDHAGCDMHFSPCRSDLSEQNRKDRD
jgi:hypothetical protein